MHKAWYPGAHCFRGLLEGDIGERSPGHQPGPAWDPLVGPDPNLDHGDSICVSSLTRLAERAMERCGTPVLAAAPPTHARHCALGPALSRATGSGAFPRQGPRRRRPRSAGAALPESRAGNVSRSRLGDGGDSALPAERGQGRAPPPPRSLPQPWVPDRTGRELRLCSLKPRRRS